ncbi:MAG: nitroreductase family protein [bacterium]
MDVFKAISERSSIRSYVDKEVEQEKIDKILEVARLSPSASNKQRWKFIVVKNKETINKLAIASRNQLFIAEAPIVIVACAVESSHVMTCGQPAYTVDLSIAFSYMLLEAHALGLGACWIGAFFEEPVKEILNIPPSIKVVALTPIGYAKGELVVPKKRKTLSEIVCYEEYQ